MAYKYLMSIAEPCVKWQFVPKTNVAAKRLSKNKKTIKKTNQIQQKQLGEKSAKKLRTSNRRKTKKFLNRKTIFLM